MAGEDGLPRACNSRASSFYLTPRESLTPPRATFPLNLTFSPVEKE
jgi:hypothetical protein